MRLVGVTRWEMEERLRRQLDLQGWECASCGKRIAPRSRIARCYDGQGISHARCVSFRAPRARTAAEAIEHLSAAARETRDSILAATIGPVVVWYLDRRQRR